MPQHSYVISDGDGLTVLGNLNDAFAAIATGNSGTSAPPALYQGLVWMDTNTPSATEFTRYIYDGTDHISMGLVDVTSNYYRPTAGYGSASAPGFTFAGDTDTGIYRSGANAIGFSTGGAARLFIDASGNVNIVGTGTFQLDGIAVNATAAELNYNAGLRTASGRIWVGAASFPAGNPGAVNVHSAAGVPFSSYVASTATFVHHYFNNPNGAVGQITTNGVTTTYSTSSDYRLKEDVQPLEGSVDRIKQMNPCSYNWKWDGSPARGFLAHEMQVIVPQAVTGEKDAVDGEGKPVMQGIDHGYLMPDVVAALKELVSRVEALEVA